MTLDSLQQVPMSGVERHIAIGEGQPSNQGCRFLPAEGQSPPAEEFAHPALPVLALFAEAHGGAGGSERQHSKLASMLNDENELVDLYLPRKW